MISILCFLLVLRFFGFIFWEFLFFLFVCFFLFFVKYPLGVSYLSYFIGVDMLSFSLCCLRFWISSLMVLASGNLKKKSFFNEFFIIISFIRINQLFFKSHMKLLTIFKNTIMRHSTSNQNIKNKSKNRNNINDKKPRPRRCRTLSFSKNNNH